MLIHWDHASRALKAALARPPAARLDTFYQLRYRAIAGPARIPDPARARGRAAGLPSLIWPRWALRLMPPGDFDFLRYRAALAMMLAVAVTGAEDYATAQQLRGLEPFPPAGWPLSPPGSTSTASWNQTLLRSASSPASSASTAPRSTTPAADGWAASPRSSSTSPRPVRPGSASGTTSAAGPTPSDRLRRAIRPRRDARPQHAG